MNIKTSGRQNIIHRQLRAPTVFLLLLLKLTKDVKNIWTIKKSITLFLNLCTFTDLHVQICPYEKIIFYLFELKRYELIGKLKHIQNTHSITRILSFKLIVQTLYNISVLYFLNIVYN